MVMKSFISCVIHSGSSSSSSDCSSSESETTSDKSNCWMTSRCRSGSDWAKPKESIFGLTDKSSSDVAGVDSVWMVEVDEIDAPLMLEIDDAGEWVGLLKRMGGSFVAGDRVRDIGEAVRA